MSDAVRAVSEAASVRFRVGHRLVLVYATAKKAEQAGKEYRLLCDKSDPRIVVGDVSDAVHVAAVEAEIRSPVTRDEALEPSIVYLVPLSCAEALKAAFIEVDASKPSAALTVKRDTSPAPIAVRAGVAGDIGDVVDRVRAGLGEHAVAVPTAGMGNRATDALAVGYDQMAARHAANDLSREATIGALEDFIRQVGRDLGVKVEGADGYQALRTAIIDLRMGRNGPDLWRAWIDPLVDLLGIRDPLKPGYLAPVVSAIRALKHAERAERAEGTVLARESDVLAQATSTLERLDTAAGSLRSLLAEAEARSVERARLAASGTDSVAAVVDDVKRLLVRIEDLSTRTPTGTESRCLRALRRGLDTTVVTYEDTRDASVGSPA